MSVTIFNIAFTFFIFLFNPEKNETKFNTENDIWE